MRWSRFLSLMIALPVASGCVVLPAPSIARMEDKFKLEQQTAENDTMLIGGRNATPPPAGGFFSTSGNGFFALFVAGCRDAAYQQNTIASLGQIVYAADRTLLGPTSLADQIGYQVIPEGADWKAPDAFARELSEAHVRYLVYVTEDVDTTVHAPLWVPLFGIAACEHRTTLEARMWEVPSGRFLGSVSTSATSEFVVVSYLVNVGFEPHTQARATSELADEIVRKFARPAADSASSVAR